MPIEEIFLRNCFADASVIRRDHASAEDQQMSTSNEIPEDLSFAFEQAVAVFDEWDEGGDEPKIKFRGNNHSIQSVSDFAMAYVSFVSDLIHDSVADFAGEFSAGPEALGHDCSAPNDHTYQEVAACLSRLSQARRDYYDGLKAMRKTKHAKSAQPLRPSSLA